MDSFEDVLNHFAELGVELQAQLGRTVAVSSQAHGTVHLVFVGVSEYEDAGWLLCMREPASTKVEGVHPSRIDSDQWGWLARKPVELPFRRYRGHQGMMRIEITNKEKHILTENGLLAAE